MSFILDGITVVDLTVARAGPTTVRLLSDFGADVVRIETPSDTNSIVRDHESSDYLNLHTNKRLMTLDLKSGEGRDVLLALLARADVLIENFRPDVKQRLGIDYETLREQFPSLIYGSISGYGQSGPQAGRGAVDQIMQGMTGLMSVTGLPEYGPVRVGIAISDLAAGTILANGILLALMERERSGLGQWVHTSLVESLLSFLDFQAARWTVDGQVADLEGNHHPSSSPMGAFDAADGMLNVAAPSDRLFERLAQALDAPGLLQDASFSTAKLRHEHRFELRKQLQDLFATRTRADWIARLDAAGVPCGPVNTIAEAFADEQVRHLDMTVPVEHPTRGRVNILRNPLTMSRTERAPKTPSPIASQHTDEILSELGYSSHDIDDLRSRGVV